MTLGADRKGEIRVIMLALLNELYIYLESSLFILDLITLNFFYGKKAIGEENIEIGKIERKNFMLKINNLKNTMVLVN